MKEVFLLDSAESTTFWLSYAPKEGSLKIKLNGETLVEGRDFTVDYTTGEVTVNIKSTNRSLVVIQYEPA